MNYIKIQNEILKAKLKSEINGKRFSYLCGKSNGTIGIVDNGYVVYLIPNRFYYLDNNKIFDSDSSNIIEKMIELELDAHEYTFNHIRLLNDRKIDVAILKDENENEIAFDIKYLKNIGLTANECTFSGTSNRNPIYVYEYDVLVAVIMPVIL